jgi:hypothetical protein
MRRSSKLPWLAENFDLHEVHKLPGERLDTLLKSRKVGLYLRPQQSLHAVVGELRPQLANRASGVFEKAGECHAYARLRSRPFENDAVEDFDLVEMVALRFKELPPLLNGGFHNGVVIRREGNLRPVLLEEVLVNMEAWAKSLQGGLEPFDRILLVRVVKALVVHAGDVQYHPKIARLRKERRLVPKPIEVDVVVERRALPPRLEDSIEAEHQTTSTRGTPCLAAS